MYRNLRIYEVSLELTNIELVDLELSHTKEKFEGLHPCPAYPQNQTGIMKGT